MEMPDPIHDKLLHSEMRVKHLEGVLHSYFETDPHGIVGEVDSATDDMVIRYELPESLPTIISLTLGDALQNLRSVLDYLVWELVIVNEKKPCKYNAFPVTLSPESLAKAKAGRRLKGVSVEAALLVESLQPFNTHPGVERESPLFVLDELVNFNKHRTIVLTKLNQAYMAEIGIYDVSGKLVGFDPSLASDKEVTFRIPANQMQPHNPVAMYITLDEGAAKGKEITRTVNGLIRYMHETVLPLFSEFF